VKRKAPAPMPMPAQAAGERADWSAVVGDDGDGLLLSEEVCCGAAAVGCAVGAMGNGACVGAGVGEVSIRRDEKDIDSMALKVRVAAAA
jgi:hypothetical protein